MKKRIKVKHIMDSKANRQGNTKVTERVDKLCNTIRGLSDKDITSLSYIVEKSSRIATVTLLLTDVLESNTPLRDELQRTAMRLIRDSSMGAHSTVNRESLSTALLTLVALLDTAGRAGQLSRMNTETLSEEATSLSEFLNTIDWHTGRRFAERSLFGGDAPRDVFSPEPLPTQTTPFKRQERDTDTPSQRQKEVMGDVYATRTPQENETKGRVQYRERVQEIQKDRRATILGIVQKKDRISVKDVANVIKDCSEKTIQRELLALVKQGVLKKEGERRWSTYSLA